MPRNYEKYVYAELAIPRNSAWFPLLVAEAEAKGQPLAQIALERLAASYLRGGQLRGSTGLPASAPGRMLPLAADGALEDDTELELNEQQAASNAAAFLDDNGGGFF